jgi:predicted aldo/keto reductase-like oxidoreductase
MEMEYRILGRTGLRVSRIGIGTEHLALAAPEIEDVLRTAAAAGVDYIDVLYIDVHGTDAGFWEVFGPVFAPYRARFTVAAHWGGGPRYDLDYCRRCFDEVLDHLGDGHAEIGLMTMVDTERKWREWAQDSIAELRQYCAAGRIDHIGLSTHRASIALEAVRSGQIDVLMYPLNLTATLHENDLAVCRACAEAGVGLVAMKVFGGGSLLDGGARPAPATVPQCLEYVHSLPVATTVPGVRTGRDLREVLAARDLPPEQRDYRAVGPHLADYLKGVCAYCNHCLPCPQELDIAQVNFLVFWGNWAFEMESDQREEILAAYAALDTKASDCIACGICMERCPYEVDVIANMRRAVELYEA